MHHVPVPSTSNYSYRDAAGLPITILNGQLDLICCTLGVDTWLDRLQWDGLMRFQALSLKAVHARKSPHETTAFAKQHENLLLYIILNAGHMVPADQPVAALELVDRVIQYASSSSTRA